MDKRKPTYQLTEIKRLIIEERLLITTSARKTIDILGFSPRAVREIVLALNPEDFYKSTTEFASHAVWQDVYKKSIGNVNVYIKLKIINMNERVLVIMSFKQDENSYAERNKG